MPCKYGEFEFPASAGFTGSAGVQHVKGYARGGRAKKTTPAQRAKVDKVMGEFGDGQLHSGSKTGPKVKNRKQAVAIALNEAGLSKKAPVKKAAGGALSRGYPAHSDRPIIGG